MPTIQDAIQKLNQNEVIGLPTETVYGLAARIDSEAAIRKIFSLKKRPFFDPLIVHVANVDQARSLVMDWPTAAHALTKKFWPGPLTLVLPKNSQVNSLITSGLETVGLRQPQHPMALELLHQLQCPLAAPSANLFGRTSPTTAEHVRSEFQNLLVLDGGPCHVGIESTILSIENKSQLNLLRKGAISAKDIEECLRQNQVPFEWVELKSPSISPGSMKHHYMPKIPLILCKEILPSKELLHIINQRITEMPGEVEGVQILKPNKPIQKIETLQLSHQPELAAREFYAELRRIAQTSAEAIIFVKEDFHSQEKWEPLMDRMNKAASLIV